MFKFWEILVFDYRGRERMSVIWDWLKLKCFDTVTSTVIIFLKYVEYFAGVLVIFVIFVIVFVEI